jgi:glycosyltransferase involved in cell wall biosynthesis
MQRRILGSVPRVLGVSGYTVGRLRGQGCPAASVLHIPTDCALFAPPADPAPAGLLGFAARFEDPRKNLSMLLEAVALAKRDGVPVRLRLAGTDPSAATRALVARLGIAAEVEFLGELPAKALPDFYRSLDVFVLPSHQEGLCISGVEALASGVPVVSTRCGGPQDYVVDGTSGLLCDTSATAMAAAIARIVRDRALRARLSDGGRALAMRDFSHAAFAAGLADAWHAVWGDRP